MDSHFTCESMTNRLVRRAAAVWVAWTLWGLFGASRNSLLYSLDGQPLVLWRPFLIAVLVAWFWAAITPLVFLLARRFPLRLPPRPLSLVVHTAAALAAAAGGLTTQMLAANAPQGLRADRFLAVYLNQLNTNILLYAALVAGYAFVRHHEERRERAVRDAQLEAELARAQLDALRMQFQPHFLFNSLNAISELFHRDPVLAERMIARLGDLLRMSLDQQEQEISLGQELEFLDRYLDIQKARFGDRLQTRTEIEPATLADALVPSFLLQPLVENAIKHGVGTLNASGSIVVRARQGADDSLVLEVCDDGVGLPANFQSNIGLRNTADRVRHLYGPTARVELKSNEGRGATASVRIPLRMLTESTV